MRFWSVSFAWKDGVRPRNARLRLVCAPSKTLFLTNASQRRANTKIKDVDCIIFQDVTFITQPETQMYLSTKMESEAGPLPCNRLLKPPNLSRNTRVKVTHFARPLLTSVAKSM